MNEEKILQLKNAMKELMAMIVQRGQPLTRELRDMLFQVMQHVAERIEQLRAEGGQLAPGPLVDQLEPSGPSSNVEGFAYDPKARKLLVRFLGKYPNRNGGVYAYDKVPPEVFDLLRKGAIPARTDGKNRWGKWWKGKTPSFGASVYTLIKGGGYNYRKMA